MSSLDELLEKEKDRRRKRAAKFGTEFDETLEVTVSTEDAREELQKTPLEPRKDASLANGATLARDTALHLHGVRFLSSVDVVHMFRGHGVQSIEWVSNDACNVVFDSAFASKRAMLAVGKLEGDADMATTDGEDQPSRVVLSGDALPWYVAKSTSSQGDWPVVFRQAVVSDHKKLLTEIMRCLGKTDGSSAEVIKASARASNEFGGAKRARPSSDSAAGFGLPRDLDAPASGLGSAPPLPSVMAPTVASVLMSAWPQPVVGAVPEPPETGDLRDKLRQSEDLRDKLKQKGLEHADEEEGPRPDDLRSVIDRQRQERRRESVKSRLQEQGVKGDVKGGGGRMFMQSVARLKQGEKDAC